MADPSVTDAISLETQDVSKMLCIKDVHIGVFFDGTNNNMVQQAYFHTYKSAKGKKEVEPITDGYEKWESLQKKRDTLEADIIILPLATISMLKIRDMHKSIRCYPPTTSNMI